MEVSLIHMTYPVVRVEVLGDIPPGKFVRSG